jgi:hypothetical protein
MPRGEHKQVSFEEAQKRLNSINITIKKDTYVGFTSKCVLIDPVYGEWVTKPTRAYHAKNKHPKRAKAEYKGHVKLTEEQVNNKLKGRNLKVKSETYKGMNYPATFIDPEFGEWTALAVNVICNKSNHPERGQKNKSLSQNRRAILKHWKTGKDVVCVGSYECYIVELLNLYRIDFDWQICFKLENGKRYYIDCFIKEFDIYVEIKGRVREDWVSKWNLFKLNYPNLKSYVIDYEYLRSIGYSNTKHRNKYFDNKEE